MVSLFLLLGCNLSYIADLFAALHELASAGARTLLKLTSSVRALLKPYGDTYKLLRIVRLPYQGYFFPVARVNLPGRVTLPPCKQALDYWSLGTLLFP